MKAPMDDVKLPEVQDMTPSKSELMSRFRSLAAGGIVVPVAMRLFSQTGTYTDVFQYHPICMMCAFVMVMPDVVIGIKRLRQPRRRLVRQPGETSTPLEASLPRDEIIMRHQLASFLMELAAAGGFAAVEYVKITNNYAHLASPHGIVGALCGAAILCQMALGAALRYALAPAHPKRRHVRTAHKYVSVAIAVTGMMAMLGGLLATEYAEKMIPSSVLRTSVAAAAVGTTVVGFFI
ncbi:ferric reductase transmembrane protein-like protein [Novymonas esmeraldas]|uniref:Ferric reductase transmembrane protein-like protein n=1 Tax=Novymonas esmeraldas TaxID=1808958 RepID=A0AAW0F7Q3_9TRYP